MLDGVELQKQVFDCDRPVDPPRAQVSPGVSSRFPRYNPTLPYLSCRLTLAHGVSPSCFIPRKNSQTGRETRYCVPGKYDTCHVTKIRCTWPGFLYPCKGINIPYALLSYCMTVAQFWKRRRRLCRADGVVAVAGFHKRQPHGQWSFEDDHLETLSVLAIHQIVTAMHIHEHFNHFHGWEQPQSRQVEASHPSRFWPEYIHTQRIFPPHLTRQRCNTASKRVRFRTDKLIPL